MLHNNSGNVPKKDYHFTMGSDPEFMLKDSKTGKVVSAIPIIVGNKNNRADLGDGYLCFHDNVLLETNIPADGSKAAVLANIRTGIGKIAAFISGYELATQASHDFTKEECEHDDAKVVGCSVEYDAYTSAECTPPDFQGTKRSAGGHIHLGRSDFKDYVDLAADNAYFIKDGVDATGLCLIDVDSKVEIIKLMDVMVGLPLVLIDTDPTSPARKSLYGKAGRLRPCPYGVEYRTPSNFWLSSPKLADLVYDLSMHVLKIADSGKGASTLARFDPQDVQNAINDNDLGLARQLVEMALDDNSELLDRVMDAAKLKVGSLYAEWAV